LYFYIFPLILSLDPELKNMEQHYRLTLADAIAKYQSGDITAKGLIHFYILIRCKPGWKIRLEHQKVCPELGISKAAFYSAISRLRTESSIKWEAPQGILVSLSISAPVCERGLASTNLDCESTNLDCESTNLDCESTNLDCKFLKPLTDKACGDSSNLLTTSYQLFLSSLSDSEREKFLEFGLKKAMELPKPPQLPMKWVERNWQELSAEFKKSAPTPVDWSQHPRRDDWIKEIRQGRPQFIVLGGPKEEQETRRQFAEWALVNNLVWGAES
jgi:hypothetical protein